MNEGRHLSPTGLATLEVLEGRRTMSYLDAGGILTAGVGHTGPDVVAGAHYSDQQINAWLAKNVGETETEVRDAITQPLTQNQFDACVLLTYNIGGKNFAGSSIARYINADDIADAARSFVLWDHARIDGKLVEVDGLRRRRLAESAIFSTKEAPAVTVLPIDYVEMAPVDPHPAVLQSTFHPEHSAIGTVEPPPDNGAHQAVTIGGAVTVISAFFEQMFQNAVPVHDLVIGAGFTQREVIVALGSIGVTAGGYAIYNHIKRGKIGIA
jgi:lysozyme